MKILSLCIFLSLDEKQEKTRRHGADKDSILSSKRGLKEMFDTSSIKKINSALFKIGGSRLYSNMSSEEAEEKGLSE